MTTARCLIGAVGIMLAAAACAGPAMPPAPTATLTPPPTLLRTPIPRATPTLAPAVSPTPRPTALPTPTPTPTPTPSPSAPPGTAEEIETLRQLAFDYWAAFNSYDAEKVLSYLEDSYGAKRESAIRRDIGRIQRFRVKLGVSEDSPPRITGVGKGEMFLLMKEPLGTRRILMSFVKVQREWKISYAEEVR